MLGRGLRADIRRDTYARIIDADPVGARPALAAARGPKAFTMPERDAREQRKPCKIFLGAGDSCERINCGHDRAAHQFVWKKAC